MILTINVSFSIRITLNNNSKLVKEDSILYEEAQFRIDLKKNKMNALLQFPFNDKKAKEYTSQECLNMDCVMNLIDSNGTGITALSLNETFSNILLEIKGGSDLEEDLSETIEKIADLFISGFNDQIGLLINALLNRTVINLANDKLNEFLYSMNCPGVPELDDTQVDKTITSIAYILVSSLFFIFIFFPYILGKACKKGKNTNQINLLENENIPK